ncbi:hypothetical protein PTKIN_Ptkin18bG0121800 [Pterospermum kingtungense]
MEHGPWYLPISEKMHTQPCLSVRNWDYTQAFAQVMGNGHANGAYLSWRSPNKIMPQCQGTSQPPFVGAPLEKRKLNKLVIELVLTASEDIVVAPINRVQLLMQNQNAMIQSGRLSRPYKGIFNCFATTIRNEGFISLWRGNTAKVMASSLMKVIEYASVSCVKSNWDIGGMLAFGGLLAAHQLIPYPLVYAATRFANDIKTTKVGKRQFNGIVDVCIKTLKSDGIAGLYRGFQVDFTGGVMASIVGYRLSAALKSQQLLRSLGLQNNVLATTMVLLGIGVCKMIASYPLETMCSRMMMTSGEAIKYKNTPDMVWQILKNEGLKSFYHGGCAAMLSMVASQAFFLFLLYLIAPGDVNKGKKKESGDGGDPTHKLTIRWRKGNAEKF